MENFCFLLKHMRSSVAIILRQPKMIDYMRKTNRYKKAKSSTKQSGIKRKIEFIRERRG